MANNLDMTSGNPLKQIYTFTIPLFIANIFQQLYIVADGIIVDRLLGVSSFAAIGAASFYYSMVLNIILGLAYGFSTYYAQLFGAHNYAGLRKSVARTLALSPIICIGLTVLSLFLIIPMLKLVETPHEIIIESTTYLYWALSTLSISFAYNCAAGLLRAVGNSKAPLVSVMVSSILNIAFDYLFIAKFNMGVGGAALATAIAALASLIYCLMELKKLKFIHLENQDYKRDGIIDKNLFRMGAPLAARNLVISTGTLLLQSAINAYGTLFVAGMTAASKFFGVMNLVSSALEASTAVFIGQNFGAGKLDRVKTGIKVFASTALVSSIIIAVLTIAFGRSIATIFISDDVGNINAAIVVAQKCLTAFSVCLPALYLLFVYRAGLQGLGNTACPMFSGLVELLFRAAALFLSMSVGEWGVFFADGVAWIGAGAFLVISYNKVYKNAARI